MSSHVRPPSIANRAESSFLAHMSHEIGTPLNAMLCMASTMRRGGATTEQAGQLAETDATAKGLRLLSDCACFPTAPGCPASCAAMPPG